MRRDAAWDRDGAGSPDGAAQGPWAEAALSAWSHRARRLREALERASSAEGAEAWEEEGRRLGWCLGALAAGAGADLLRARREPLGTLWLLELTAEALAAAGREVALEGDPGPGAAGDSGRGVLAAQLFAQALWEAARAAPGPLACRWERRAGCEVLRLTGAAVPRPLGLRERFPELRVRERWGSRGGAVVLGVGRTREDAP